MSINHMDARRLIASVEDVHLELSRSKNLLSGNDLERRELLDAVETAIDLIADLIYALERRVASRSAPLIRLKQHEVRAVTSARLLTATIGLFHMRESLIEPDYLH